MIANENAGAMLCMVIMAVASIVCASIFGDGDKDFLMLIYSNAVTGVSALATGRQWGKNFPPNAQ